MAPRTVLRLMQKSVRKLVGYLVVVLAIQSAIASGQQQPALVTQTGHTGEVIAVAANANGTLIATGGDDATIKVWHAASRRIVRTLRGQSMVMSLAFHPRLQVLASAGISDSSIKLWNLADGGTPRELEGPPVTYGTLAFSPDGSWLIHGGPFGITAWEMATGTRKQIDKRQFEVLALSPDGAILATGDTEGTIRIWRGSQRNITKTLAAVPQTIARTQRHGGVFGLAISPDNRWLVSVGASIDVWDLKTNKHFKTLGHPAISVKRPVAFSPDGSLLAAADTDQVVELGKPTGGGTFAGVENAALTLWRPGVWKETRTLSGHTAAINAIAFNRDGEDVSVVSASRDGTVRFWDPTRQSEVSNPTQNVAPVTAVVFTTDDRLVASAGRVVVVWDLATGAPQLQLIGHAKAVTSVALSPDGKLIASGSEDKTVRLWDASTGKLRQTFTEPAIDVKCVVFSLDGKTLAVGGTDEGDGSVADQEGVIVLIHLASVDPPQVIRAHLGAVTSLAFSPDRKMLASSSILLTRSGKVPENESTLSFWEVATGKEIESPIGRQTLSTKAIAYNSDGSILAVGGAAIDPADARKRFLAGGDTVISVVDAKTGRTESTQVIKQEYGEFSNQDLRLWSGAGRSLPTEPHSGIVTAVSFLPGGRILATGAADSNISLWDVESGHVTKTLSGHSGIVNALAVSRDGQVMASGGQDGTIVLWTLNNKEVLARLVYLGPNAWIVAQPDGHFDTNDLEEIPTVQWIFPDDPFRPLPPEIFMRQYYEPRLLPRLLQEKSFDAVPALASLNRVQPEVKIRSVAPLSSSKGYVNVTLDVANAVGEQMHDGKRVALDSEVHDLRLFRDGQLVGYVPGKIALDSTGKATLNRAVKLPQRGDLSEVEFTAYAFNSDQVKSATFHFAYQPTEASPAVKKRAYIISVGVNAYEDSTWDLSFAARDAQLSEELLTKNLTTAGEYEVMPIRLISDYQVIAAARVVREKLATRQNFQTVLNILARGPAKVDPQLLQEIPGANKLRQAEPRDLVLINFSSHGYTDRHGKFYLVPYDTGSQVRFTPDGQEIRAESLAHFISSDDLSEWLRDIDAGELVMIVDTCHSASAVEEPGFKPGPMGSRGMGQLAYDKGMRLLAASQSDDVALELEKLRQGLLTYALMQDGLGEGKADKNGDGQITLAEWLAYGAERVPTLYGDVKAGRVNELKRKDVHITAVLSGASVKKSAFQQPQLFDFKRKSRDLLLANTSGKVSG